MKHIHLSLALIVAVSGFACDAPDAEPAAHAADEAALTLVDLDGESRVLEEGALDYTDLGLRWDTRVDGEHFTVEYRRHDDEDLFVVFGPDDRLLFDARVGETLRFDAHLGDDAARFDRELPLVGVEGAESVSAADDTLAFSAPVETRRFFEPLVDAGNTVAPVLALVAMPIIVERALEAEGVGVFDISATQSQNPIIAGAGVLVAAFGLGVTMGAAYCNRSSTSASCTDSEGNGRSVTCNACQGQATCTKVPVSGGSGAAIVLGADDDGDDAYSCNCYCPGG